MFLLADLFSTSSRAMPSRGLLIPRGVCLACSYEGFFTQVIYMGFMCSGGYLSIALSTHRSIYLSVC